MIVQGSSVECRQDENGRLRWGSSLVRSAAGKPAEVSRLLALRRSRASSMLPAAAVRVELYADPVVDTVPFRVVMGRAGP